MNSVKKLMVMGAAIEQVPGIKKAKELGYRVGVIDYNPKAVGIPLADEYFNVSTINCEEVLKAAKEFGTNGFLTLATDLPMRAVAYACEKLGLPGISRHTALLATDKGEMIKALKMHNVESPWYYLVDSIDDLKTLESQISYPCIMKPTDNAASRGVILIHNVNELCKAYEYSKTSSHSGQVIIEEYMQGAEVSVEILTYDGNPVVLQITDKITSGPPHFVETGHNQPSALPIQIQEQIKDVARRAVLALGIQIGPAHVEIIITEDGPKVVELGARLGGDCITSHLVLLSTGIDMVKETIKLMCGEKPCLVPKYEKGAAIRFLKSKALGKFEYIQGEEEARKMRGVIEVSEIMRPGEIIETIRSSDDRVAYVIAQANTVKEAVLIAERAEESMHVHVKQEETENV